MTPQEIIDEERDYYESINEPVPEYGCISTIIVLITLILLYYVSI